MNKQKFLAIGVLVATIIGGGIFALPYAFAQAGFWPSLLVFVGLAVINVVVMLMFGEVVLRTKGDNHQATGYAHIYLGKTGKFLMLLVQIIGSYGGLLIYILGVGNFLNDLFNGGIEGGDVWWGVAFFAVASVFVIMGVKKIAQLDRVLFFVFLGIIFLILFLAFPNINVLNFQTVDFGNILFPFGVIIFALSGSSAIPLLDNMLSKQKSDMKGVIIAGVVIATFINLIFVIAILGMGGAGTSPGAIVTVQEYLPSYASFMLGIFGVIAMGTSFLTTAVVMREVYEFDYRVKRWLSLTLVLLIPFGMYLANLAGFVDTIGFVGSMTGGLGAILYVFMFRRAKQMGEVEPGYKINYSTFVQVVVIAVYAFAMAQEVYYLISK